MKVALVMGLVLVGAIVAFMALSVFLGHRVPDAVQRPARRVVTQAEREAFEKAKVKNLEDMETARQAAAANARLAELCPAGIDEYKRRNDRVEWFIRNDIARMELSTKDAHRDTTCRVKVSSLAYWNALSNDDERAFARLWFCTLNEMDGCATVTLFNEHTGRKLATYDRLGIYEDLP